MQSSAPDDGRKHCPKHVDLTWNNKLIDIVHLVGYFHSCSYQLQEQELSKTCALLLVSWARLFRRIGFKYRGHSYKHSGITVHEFLQLFQFFTPIKARKHASLRNAQFIILHTSYAKQVSDISELNAKANLCPYFEPTICQAMMMQISKTLFSFKLSKFL